MVSVRILFFEKISAIAVQRAYKIFKTYELLVLQLSIKQNFTFCVALIKLTPGDLRSLEQVNSSVN